MRSRRLITVLAAAVMVLTAACGGGSAPEAQPTSTTATTSTSTTVAEVKAQVDAPAADEAPDHESLVARAETELAVFASPGDESPSQVLPATTGFGSRRALLVLTDEGEWLEVLLPVRPNGSTGWIKRADVEIRVIDTEVTVDLAARTLTVYQAGEPVLETTVAVGADAYPTPVGTYSVVDKLDTAQPNGPYGPFAFGLSGHSDVLTDFAGGEGQIGIHGTNQPDSIGQAVSHGCVRVPNDVAVALNGLLPLGTPVTITA